jgi:hypothetical protein
MSKHERNIEATDASQDENTSRPHGGPISNSTGPVQGIKADDLSVGDVVVIDRSVGTIEAKTYATVVAIDERGSRLVGPDYPSPAFGAALHIERVTSYDRLVGRDSDGAFHLLRHSDGGDRVLEVVAEREQDVADREVSVHGEKQSKTMAEQQEYVVASIGEVGPVTARAMLEHFGSVEAVLTADKEALLEVDGVGEVTADRVREVVGGDYSPAE